MVQVHYNHKSVDNAFKTIPKIAPKLPLEAALPSCLTFSKITIHTGTNLKSLNKSQSQRNHCVSKSQVQIASFAASFAENSPENLSKDRSVLGGADDKMQHFHVSKIRAFLGC